MPRPDPPSPTVARDFRIPGFRLLRRVGVGGMGSVFEAEQEEPRRRVALKILRLDALSEESLARFEAEARALARLQHPGIAGIYATGRFEAPGGELPYLVMELVDGPSITGYADREGLEREARVRLLLRVCDAVSHAHRRGILHRDLKPSNVLVPDDGVPRLLDFGVSRETDRAGPHTHTGHLLGTLAYMSPEQARGARDLDTRADVYSLGVLAFQLLTGRLPIDVDGLPLHEAVRAVAEVRPASLGRGDLAVVVNKALAKDPERRYDSVTAFAHDLRRVLDRRPILARAPSALYLVRRLVQRNRAATAAIATVFLALSAVLATAVLAARDARRQERRAHQARLASRLMAVSAFVDMGEHTTARRTLLTIDAEDGGWLHAHLAASVDRTVGSRPAPPDDALPVWIPGEPNVWAGAGDGDVVAVGTRDSLAAYDRRSRQRLWSQPAARVYQLRIAARGGPVAVLSSEGLRVHEARTGVVLAHWSEIPQYFAVSPDGNLVALRCERRIALRRIDGTTVREWPNAGAACLSLAFSPDTTRLAAGFADGSVRNWEIASGALAGISFGNEPAPVLALRWSLDSERLFCTTEQGVEEERLADERMVRPALRGHRGPAQGNRYPYVYSVAFAPDGNTFVSAGWDETVRVWSNSGRLVRTLELGIRGQHCAFAGRDRLLVAGPRAIQLWDPDAGRRLASRAIDLFGCAADGRGFVAAARTGLLFLDRDSLEERGRIDGSFSAVAWDAAGGVAGTSDGHIAVVRDGRLVSRMRAHRGPVEGVALSPDGRLVASVSIDGRLSLRDRNTLAARIDEPVTSTRLFAVAFSPDSRQLFVGGDEGAIRVWDTETGYELGRLSGHESYVKELAMSPDGEVLASASGDNTVRLWFRRPARERLRSR